jgi:hypothetical protein
VLHGAASAVMTTALEWALECEARWICRVESYAAIGLRIKVVLSVQIRYLEDFSRQWSRSQREKPTQS